MHHNEVTFKADLRAYAKASNWCPYSFFCYCALLYAHFADGFLNFDFAVRTYILVEHTYV